jgi:dipeptidyl aminopeptidase/acylaminoacyl peptidase
VLLVCARYPDLVRAGVSLYGVTDLFDLAATTHRFESRYLDRVVGRLPEHAARYRARSPVTHAAAIKVPLLVVHGADDPAVPVAQAEALVQGVRNAGGTVEYQRYEHEGHGWKRASTIEDELARTERFLRTWVLERGAV